jgi:hypothetical protein
MPILFWLKFVVGCKQKIVMIPEAELKISLEELALRGGRIIAKQRPISYADALRQVQWLKENSKVKQTSKKNRLNS